MAVSTYSNSWLHLILRSAHAGKSKFDPFSTQLVNGKMAVFHIQLMTIFVISNVHLHASKCIDIMDRSCLSIQLKYNWTSLPQSMDNRNETQARQKLDSWLELQMVPACWETIAPFLCQTYIPKCANGSIFLPCQSICRKVRTVCGMIPNFNKGKWPSLLQCDDYPTKDCLQVKSLENQSVRCYYPLVKTGYKKSWYGGIQGCGLQCKNQFYSDDEHTELQRIVAIFGSLSMFCNLFSVATFIIDWKAQSKYPAKIIFFMNLCFCLSSCGWLLQFLGDTRSKITCRQDGTKRLGEPGSESTYGWCIVCFLLIYYGAFAGILWFVMLSYAWHNSFRTLGSTKDQLSGKKTYFHVLSWMIPVLSTITILVLEEVDAEPLAGICFVGISKPWMKFGFVLVPFGICLVIGEILMIRGTMILFKVKGQNLTFLNGRASTKIKETIVRISLFSVLSCLFFATFIINHVHESTNWESWEHSLMDFLRCEASRVFFNKQRKCELKNRPSLPLYRLQIIATFGAGMTVSTWSWTKATLKTWKKAWIRFRGFDVKKRIYNSFNARRNRRKVNPVVEQAFPAIAMALPVATRAAKRGSVTSMQSQRRGSAMKISSFVSELAEDILSRMKMRSATNLRRNENDFYNSPVLIRPRDGRRRSLLSIESLLTTSSQGKLRFRRANSQISAGGGSEFGLAFGHVWPIQAQLNVPTKTGKNERFKNLRVIRLGEDLPSTVLKEEKNEKRENEVKHKKKKKRKSANKIDAVNYPVDAQAICSAHVGLDAHSDDASKVSSSSCNQRYLPALKSELRQRSPCRWSESSETSPSPFYIVSQNNKSASNLFSPLKFFHETVIEPNNKEKKDRCSSIEKSGNEKRNE